MAYNYARQAIKFIYLPLIVSNLHYVVYLTILEVLPFGLGVTFARQRNVLKLQSTFPEKVIIASEKSGIWKTMKSSGSEIFRLSSAQTVGRSFGQDDLSFLRSAYAFVFNAEWKKKYLDYWLEKLKAGKTRREDVFDSPLKQAAEIYY